MQQIVKKFLFIICIIFSYASFAQAPHAPQTQPSPAPVADTSHEDLNSLVQVLENPQTRDAFIQQLKGLAISQTTSETALIKEEGTLLLHNLADSLESLAHQFDEVTDDITNIPTFFAWIASEIKSAERRAFWEDVLFNMLQIVGSAYLLLLLSRWLFMPVKQKILQQAPTHKSAYLSNFAALVLIDLMPLALFVMTAYFLTGLIDPTRTIKLLVVAWINAIVIFKVLQMILEFMLNIHGKNYPLHTGNIDMPVQNKFSRLLRVAIYGYFTSQSMLILDLPQFAVEVFDLLLSTFVSTILIFWIFQYQQNVATIIRGNAEKIQASWVFNIRNTLANIWPWIALAYIITIFLIITLEIHHGVMFIVNSTLLSLLALTLSFMALNCLEWLMQYFVKWQKNRMTVAPLFETQVKSYFVVIKKALRGVIYLATIFALLSAWNIHPLNWLWFGEGHMLTAKVLRIATIIAVTFLIWVFCVSVIEYYLTMHMSKEQGTRAPRARGKTLLSVSRHFLAILLFTMSAILVISELGVNIGPLLAGAGVLGLAVGFGSQRLVQDIINGIFILLDDTVSVDDLIVTAGKRGVVEAISIRTIRLRDSNGDAHTIPFSAVDTITNQTKNYSYAMFTIKVGHRDNIADVMQAIKIAGENLQKSPAFEAWVWDNVDISGIETFTDSGLDIKGRIKTAPGKQGEVLCEFNRLVKIELDKLGISWPYHQHMRLMMGPEGAS